MKKFLAFISIFAFFGSFALEIDVKELKKSKKIEFVNFQGKGRVDSTASIKSIGRALADGVSSYGKANFMMKYSIVRIESQREPEKLAAEILSIHKDAQVDHVNNIRKILSAYFERRYGYSKAEADALAVFETYYNAFYRGNMDYLSGVYKKEVMKEIKPGNAGLSTKYYEWPGATKIIIPLTKDAGAGSVGAIEPDALSDKNVLGQIRKDESSLDARKTVADMREKDLGREKEAVAAEKKAAADEKKAAADEKKAVDAEKKKVEGEKKRLAEEEKAVEKKKNDAAKIADPQKRAQEEKKVADEAKAVEAKKAEVAKKESDVKNKEEKADEKTVAAERKEADAANKEKEIAKKEDAIKEEKKNIESDELKKDLKSGNPDAVVKLEKKEKDLNKKEEELAKKEEELKKGKTDRNVIGDKLYYLKIREFLRNGHYNNDLCMIDIANRKVLFNSPIPNISGSRYDLFSDSIVVITRVDYEYTQHRLTLVDKDTLLEKKSGKDNIFYRSFIEIRDGFIFAIINVDGQFFLGRFDKDLNLTAKSAQRISEDTFVTFYSDYVYINAEDKKILVLKKGDLSFVDKIDPSVTQSAPALSGK